MASVSMRPSDSPFLDLLPSVAKALAVTPK
jgi:hypothetical protein